jgi:hypothetical protein
VEIKHQFSSGQNSFLPIRAKQFSTNNKLEIKHQFPDNTAAFFLQSKIQDHCKRFIQRCYSIKILIQRKCSSNNDDFKPRIMQSLNLNKEQLHFKKKAVISTTSKINDKYSTCLRQNHPRLLETIACADSNNEDPKARIMHSLNFNKEQLHSKNKAVISTTSNINDKYSTCLC